MVLYLATSMVHLPRSWNVTAFQYRVYSIKYEYDTYIIFVICYVFVSDFSDEAKLKVFLKQGS